MRKRKGPKGKREPKSYRLEYEGKNRPWFEQNAKMTNHEIRGG
jgi:hypothetical protein